MQMTKTALGLSLLVVATSPAISKGLKPGTPPICNDAGPNFPVSIGRPVLLADVTPTPQKYYVDIWIPAVSTRQEVTNVLINAYLFDKRLHPVNSNGRTFPSPKFEQITTSMNGQDSFPLYSTLFDVAPDHMGVGLYQFYPKVKITIAVPGFGEQCFWTPYTPKERSKKH
jgi:hypothetical protein